jgi:hypothetical protein
VNIVNYDKNGMDGENTFMKTRVLGEPMGEPE